MLLDGKYATLRYYDSTDLTTDFSFTNRYVMLQRPI